MLDAITDALTAFVQQNNNPVGLFVLFSSALVEYLFPPFPGDTVTLFGAFLVVRYRWSSWQVFCAVLSGSMVGAMAHFYLGAWLGTRYRAGTILAQPRQRQLVERVLTAFRRWGPAYVSINRFLPGVRAVVFFAAGMAGLRARWVLFFGALSAAVWNALILALGHAVGTNWENLMAAVGAYQRVAWVVMLAVVTLFGALWWWRRR